MIAGFSIVLLVHRQCIFSFSNDQELRKLYYNTRNQFLFVLIDKIHSSGSTTKDDGTKDPQGKFEIVVKSVMQSESKKGKLKIQPMHLEYIQVRLDRWGTSIQIKYI